MGIPYTCPSIMSYNLCATIPAQTIKRDKPDSDYKLGQHRGNLLFDVKMSNVKLSECGISHICHFLWIQEEPLVQFKLLKAAMIRMN